MSRIRTTRQSFIYAIEGIRAAIKQEPNFQNHLAIGAAAVAAGLFYNISMAEWLLLIYAIFFVLILELFNTSIEAIVDLVSPEKHEKAKVAKDVAAGAVLLAAVQAVVIGAAIFLPHIL